MISSSKSKLIRSLKQKKFRYQHRLFLVEGEKMVRDLTTAHPDNRLPIQENVGHTGVAPQSKTDAESV